MISQNIWRCTYHTVCNFLDLGNNFASASGFMTSRTYTNGTERKWRDVEAKVRTGDAIILAKDGRILKNRMFFHQDHSARQECHSYQTTNNDRKKQVVLFSFLSSFCFLPCNVIEFRKKKRKSKMPFPSKNSFRHTPFFSLKG